MSRESDEIQDEITKNVNKLKQHAEPNCFVSMLEWIVTHQMPQKDILIAIKDLNERIKNTKLGDKYGLFF